jgi:hypothetical protein
MPPTLESFACAPSTNWRAQTSPTVTGVLGQASVSRLAMPELTLDHPKLMLHLGADTGFDLFNPISQFLSSALRLPGIMAIS